MLKLLNQKWKINIFIILGQLRKYMFTHLDNGEAIE